MSKLSISSRSIPLMSLFSLALALGFALVKHDNLNSLAEVFPFSKGNISLILSGIVALLTSIASYFGGNYAIKQSRYPIFFHIIYTVLGFFILELTISRKVAAISIAFVNFLLLIYLLLINEDDDE